MGLKCYYWGTLSLFLLLLSLGINLSRGSGSGGTSTNNIRSSRSWGGSGSGSGGQRGGHYDYAQLHNNNLIGKDSNGFRRRDRALVDYNSNVNLNNGNNNGPSSSSHNDNSLLNIGGVSLSVANLTNLLEEIQRNCPLYCKDQTQNNGLCVNKGCKEWKTGLRDGCSALCNGSESNLSNYGESYACQLGCSRAIKEYYRRITGLTGIPEPPVLISGSLKSSSLRLSWEGCGLPIPYLAFSIQKRFFHRSASGWETVPSQALLNQTTFTILSLKPYTEYQFRVGWIIAHDFPPFYSIESNRIETLPQGLPNPPEITSIQHISNTSVAVTWLPPTQPNGPLVAFILKLQKVPNGLANIKEIPISQNPRGYTFSGLQPVTNYSLAISAQNLEGEGDAANIYFLTPQSLMSNEVSKRPEPRLLLQGVRDVYLQNLELFSEPDVPVFASSHVISAMAAHFKYKWVFIATSDGEISRTGLERNETLTLIPKERLDFVEIAFLSVDWLHNKLYIVGKKKRSSVWSVKRSDLNGDKLVTIYPYLNAKPVDFAADPFTGYLYWVSNRTSTLRGGLYRLDLIFHDLNGPVAQPVIEVEPGESLGPFTIDVANYRLLIVHKGRNTVLSISLDGDVTNIRPSTQSPEFTQVQSLASYNGLFYWTTGTSVVMEEYNAAQDSFYHNSFDVPFIHQPVSRVLMVHPDLQPVPIPLAPPQQVQVIYAESRARVSWRPPPPISGLGEGAWLEWKYQIRVSDNRSMSNITGTEFILNDLRPSTFYTVQVLAYTASGRGPLSTQKRGKTLRESASDITLLWGSQNGLYSTNTLGENVQLLTTAPDQSLDWKAPSVISIPSGGSSEHGGGPYMWSLTWYESSVFFALSNGSVFYYDSRSIQSMQQTSVSSPKPIKETLQGSAPSASSRPPKVSHLKAISYAQSIAFDYIGQRLYWSNPKQQTILRCAFSSDLSSNPTSGIGLPSCGSSNSKDRAERLQLVTMAREIAIDSFKGLLLWSTGHSLEMSRLNGYSHGTLYQTGLFSGIQIMGITLDTDQSRIYWITRSSFGSSLLRLGYNIRGAQLPMVIANYDDVTITGPIRYFNERLIWLQGSSEAVITDLYGQGKSSLKISTIRNITNLHVKDQASLRYPGGLAKHRVQVNPDSVMKWTIVMSGKWNNFTIGWQAVNNTNYGKVLYEVVVNNSVSRITSYPNITIENSTLFTPYTEIEISLTSLTYWSSAKPTLCKLKTPSWKPTEPLNPRVFIQQSTYPYVPSDLIKIGSNSWISNALLRWDAPASPNGLILGYLIHCWKDNVKLSSASADCSCLEVEGDLSNLSCRLSGLSPQAQYTFAVQGYTDAGAGKMSVRVLTSTSKGNDSKASSSSSPLPRLLLTLTDALEILDIDRNSLESIQLGYLSPVSSAFLYSDKTVFWLNEGQDLMMAQVTSQGQGSSGNQNKTRLLTLKSEEEASHLTIDWIGRKLYWSCENTTSNVDPSLKYSIMTYDLSSDLGKSYPKVVFQSKTRILSLAVNPLRNALYWSTPRSSWSSGGISTIYTFSFGEDSGAKAPFLSRDVNQCNCSNFNAHNGEPLAFDPNSGGLIFMEKSSIVLSDEFGCNCWSLLSNVSSITGTESPTANSIVSKLASDQNHIYLTIGSGVNKKLYSVPRRLTQQAFQTLQASSLPFKELLSSKPIREIQSFGESSQPYPSINCLIPREMDPHEPLLFNHSSHSLHLNLPGAKTVNCSFPSGPQINSLSLPTAKYKVYYGTVDLQGISKCTPTSPSFCKRVSTIQPMLHITDLHPYTTYTVFVTLTNHYAQAEGLEPLVCAPIMLRTAPGAPMPPKLLRLEPLTPSAIRVVWGQPEKLNGEKVWYEVNWKTSSESSNKAIRSSSSSSSSSSSNSLGNTNLANSNGQKWAETETRSNHNRTEFYLDLNELLPSTNYTIWVVAFSEKGDAFSASEIKTEATFEAPRNLSLISATPHNISLEWLPPKELVILRHQFIYRDGWSAIWNYTKLIDFTIPGRPYSFTIDKLKPKTSYGFRIKTWYKGDPKSEFIWPMNGQFNFETLADKPGSPNQPIARGIGKAKYEVSWDKAEENGASIEMYALEYRLDLNIIMALASSSTAGGGGGDAGRDAEALNNNSSVNGSSVGVVGNASRIQTRQKREWTDGGSKVELAEKLISTNGGSGIIQSNWILVYNGTDTRWEVKGLDIESFFTFRVRAKNIYGWGEYSPESGTVNLAALTLVAEPQSVGVIIGTIFLACLILGAFGILFIIIYRQKVKEKPSLQSPGSSERREVELATLRELPGGSSFVHSSNILYAGGELILDLDFSGVPTISWAQITVTKFLGSGAFGEVYEGIATNLVGMDVRPEDQGQGGTRVAIKTLRKGANQTEKLEFIQEAKLMTQFKHPHIIQLLALCVDTDPCCLLLELMGGGDLLSFLRSNRPHLGGATCLTLVDLLKMCLDVAKGCVCLEEMHFVHRDIAARNCLVQLSPESGSDSRVVKIGDFGLARDIYRNDYYRKEGEGLLPVRWMAPESLVDGVFTTQTDVWSFGVLLWEIMTLGQQPYPARTNLEVLNYVRTGGRLQRPPHCPDILGSMMLQCWEYNPDNRISFKDCLNQLELILRDFEDNSVIDGLPPLNEINFDPYSYSEGSDTKSTHTHYTHPGGGGGGAYPDSSRPEAPSQRYPSSHPSHFQNRSHPQFPKYLEVLSDSNCSDQNQQSPSFTDQGYEIPLPKKPPRAPQRVSAPSIDQEIGLPSISMQMQNRPYWNCEPTLSSSSSTTLPLQYRNLLASSTSEDADVELEMDPEDDPLEFESSSSSCKIREHHYFPNLKNNSKSISPAHHLRGIPCSSSSSKNQNQSSPFVTNYQYYDVSSTPTTTIAPSQTSKNYNNHIYAAHSLNNPNQTDGDLRLLYRDLKNNNNKNPPGFTLPHDLEEEDDDDEERDFQGGDYTPMNHHHHHHTIHHDNLPNINHVNNNYISQHYPHPHPHPPTYVSANLNTSLNSLA